MSEQHFRSFMPHLTSKPEQVNALANVPSGERMACLVRIAIAYTSLFKGRHPGFFSDRVRVCPRGASFWIAEYKVAF